MFQLIPLKRRWSKRSPAFQRPGAVPKSGSAAFYFAITPVNNVDFAVAVLADFARGKLPSGWATSSRNTRFRSCRLVTLAGACRASWMRNSK